MMPRLRLLLVVRKFSAMGRSAYTLCMCGPDDIQTRTTARGLFADSRAPAIVSYRWFTVMGALVLPDLKHAYRCGTALIYPPAHYERIQDAKASASSARTPSKD